MSPTNMIDVLQIAIYHFFVLFVFHFLFSSVIKHFIENIHTVSKDLNTFLQLILITFQNITAHYYFHGCHFRARKKALQYIWECAMCLSIDPLFWSVQYPMTPFLFPPIPNDTLFYHMVPPIPFLKNSSSTQCPQHNDPISANYGSQYYN